MKLTSDHRVCTNDTAVCQTKSRRRHRQVLLTRMDSSGEHDPGTCFCVETFIVNKDDWHAESIPHPHVHLLAHQCVRTTALDAVFDVVGVNHYSAFGAHVEVENTCRT